MKNLQASFYQWLYAWALRRWRKVLGKPYLKSSESYLTVHALVRYFERFEGRDLVTELLTPELKATVKEYGGSGKFIVNNIRYTVVNGSIVSIAKPDKGQAIVSGLNKDSAIARKWSF